MCLAIPMKIKSIDGGFAEVESGSLIRKVNVQMLAKAVPGDYVLVHAGFAIEIVDPQRAKETLKIISET
jgi:hydrogenase expression/formation protein HypC